ncbi:hypothetical protein IKF04_00670 [Candidatus Saccharibacteria bacterium]|nr:hypothetical protein [Candidatus Saccharibacteria bacterium]
MEPANSKSFSQGAASDQVADKSSGSGGIVGTQAGATVGGVSDGVFRQESQSAPQPVQGLEPAPQPVQGLEPTLREKLQSVSGPVQNPGFASLESAQSISQPEQNPGFASLESAQSISRPEQSSEPTPQEDPNQVSQQEQKSGHMTDEEFYASFSNPVVPVNSAEGDIILNNGVKRRKKGLIIGAIVAGVGLVIGLMIFIFVVLPAMDPKTGDGIKAKNYQEAFNIYANYFLFGVRSKEAVDWDATKAEDFESYFENVINNPSEVDSILHEVDTQGSIIGRMDVDFTIFHDYYIGEEKKDEYLVQAIDDYSRYLKFMAAYYNVGTPTESTVLEKYVDSGYDAAEVDIWRIADAYSGVGIIYDIDVRDLIGRYGDNLLAVVEEYNRLGCVVNGGFDFDCTVREENAEISDYSDKANAQLDDIISIQYNSENVLINKVFILNNNLTESNMEERSSR